MQYGGTTVAALAADFLARIADNDLNAFVTVTSAAAQHQAGIVDKRVAAGDLPPLAGVMLAVKDNICLEGVRLSCASRILDGYVSPYTATALERLMDAGAVVVGKTNLDEFAMGSSGETSCFGATPNPRDRSRVPGGSSSGSAAAVAAGLCTAALGSETGGSVRQPAAFCGVIGLKPTYGRVSRYGLVAFGSSLDQIGVLAADAAECAGVFQAMAGHDPNDNTTATQPVPDPAVAPMDVISGLRVGIPEEYGGEGLEPAVARAVREVANRLRKAGAVVESCSLPHTRYAIPTYYIIAPAEASSNLARYDGVRYGYRPDLLEGEPKPTGDDLMRRVRQEGFGAEVRRRILLGTYVLSAGYYEAFYLRAQKVRRLIRDDFVAAFHSYDLLLTPTTPTTAFKLGEKVADPIAMYLSDEFTAPANLAGIPAISVPWGGDEAGLPVGVQFMADFFREDLLLGVAAFLEADDG